MSTIGTFDGFTAARLGIYAAQQGLSVTGNNISNINTTGYTRQVLDQISLKTGAYDRYRSQFDNHIGTGTLVRNINQIRDPYLDIRYRNTNASVGFADAKLNGLNEIASILDEVGKGTDGSLGDGMLYAQLKDLQDALRRLQDKPTSDNDTLVRQSASALVSLFNTYAGKLTTLKEGTEKKLEQQVTDVNEILRNIRELNEDIREAELHDDGALEMRDERNRQIDDLSSYLPISVVYSMEDIGGGREIEKLSIYLNNANPDQSVHTDESMLVDGIYAAQINIPEKMPKINDKFGLAPGDDGYDETLKDYLYLKADGTGTNDPELAAQTDDPNSNYLVTIGKLLDSENREWKKTTTEWESFVPTPEGKAATFTSTVTNADLQEGDILTIGGRDYTLTADDIKDAASLATFISRRLTHADYLVSAVGDTLTYTAKPSKLGLVGETKTDENGKLSQLGPDEEAKLPTITVSRKVGDADPAVVPGVTPVPPLAPGEKGEDPGIPPNEKSVDEFGTETSVTYARDTNGQWYKITTVTEHARAIMLDDNDLDGSIQALRELLTEAGEFTTKDVLEKVDENSIAKRGDENATVKRGIPYYQYSLDLLAQQFAASFNALNQGFMVNEKGNYFTGAGEELKLADEPINKVNGLTDAQKQALIDDGCVLYDKDNKPIVDSEGKQIPDLERWLTANGATQPEGAGVLFSNRNDNNDPSGITASNISISKNWLNREYKVVPTFTQIFDGSVNTSTLTNNVDHMVNLIDKKLTYDPNDLNAIVAGVAQNGDGSAAAGDNIFIGSFNDMFSNMCTVLGNDQRTTNVELTSDYTSLIEIDTNRDGVAGVDLNDEAMNMMQYQKAYTAACRLMTAVDEALDRLINNTGLAGR